MRLNVSPLPAASDRVNEIRELTAQIINKEILPNENRLWIFRRDGDVAESDKQVARELGMSEAHMTGSAMSYASQAPAANSNIPP